MPEVCFTALVNNDNDISGHIFSIYGSSITHFKLIT